MARHTENTIHIRATRERVFATAAAVDRWPEFLPHYRWVRVLEEDGNRRLVEMAARRDWFPVRWRASVWLWPEEGRITFEHVGGLSRGMRVAWDLRPEGDGVRVTISHELTLKHPLVAHPPGRWVVAEQFVRVIAGRTLNCLKRHLEEAAEPPPTR